MLWIENSSVPNNWRLTSEHVITGVPGNNWSVRLPRGLCVDFVSVGENTFCLRVYGFDDKFRGRCGDESTLYCGVPFSQWLKEHGIKVSDAGIASDTDIQYAAIFPVIGKDRLTGEFLQWIIDSGGDSAEKEKFRQLWISSQRFSADGICEKAQIMEMAAQRAEYAAEALPVLAGNAGRSVFHLLDLAHTAKMFGPTAFDIPVLPQNSGTVINYAHQAAFTAAVKRERGISGWENDESTAFKKLRDAIISSVAGRNLKPGSTLIEDQIIWGRSPLRIDLAGGWTDTPPYCIYSGGRVINVAIDINGQPPVQVFARKSEKPEIVIRSIDLGVEERISAFEQLSEFTNVGGAFGVVKAALCLSGFHPDFSSEQGRTFRQILEDFGGGIELSLLAAVPKGSGLGTSSILSATVLGVLNEVCGYGWDHGEIIRRTLVLEQMLTTGGGWQDQAGGLERGLKMIETTPGLVQSPQIRWLPDGLFTDTETSQCMLLYYTGITRIAKNILGQIVRSMFLNEKNTIGILSQIAGHAASSYDALLRQSYDGLCSCVRKSWQLNRLIDCGTSTEQITAVLDRIENLCAGAKLCGAGGGGYLFMLAKNPEAAARIHTALTENPPNPRARFVDMKISRTGMQITRS
jgi:galactokinase/mevalonate kinase-like predicted kinase